MFELFKEFFHYGLEYMLLHEFDIIFKSFGDMGIEDSSAAGNFHFLVDHFK
jgi:hypothetical protein